MTHPKELWFSVGPDTSVAALEAASYRAFDFIWIASSDTSLLERAPLPRGMKVALEVDDIESLDRILEESPWGTQVQIILLKNQEEIEPARTATKKKGLALGLVHAVVDQSTLEEALPLAAQVDHLVLTFRDPTNIPLELVLATTQNTHCRVVKQVDTAVDGISSSMTMECGADAVALRSNDVGEIAALEESFIRAISGEISLECAEVSAIRQAGMGDRVCVDTTSELRQDEGMLVGSTSEAGFLICSETHYLPYMELRPFRVNAGALHQYIWGPDGRTHYLSELRAGTEVLSVSATGQTRTVTVGRAKIERRPLLMIEAQAGERTVNTFIQDDWHVRLMGGGGVVRPSREIEIGDQMLVHMDRPGRHVGIAVDETIREV